MTSDREMVVRLMRTLAGVHGPGGKAHDTPTGRWLRGEALGCEHDCLLCVLLLEAEAFLDG